MSQPEPGGDVIDGLEALAPRVPDPVRFRDELIVVAPLTIDQLAPLIRKARPLVEAIMDLPDVADTELIDLVLTLIETHTPALTEALAVAIDRPREFIGKAPLEDFTRLSMAVFEVNRDFFVQTLGPRLARAWATKRKAASGDGPIASRP